MAFQTVGRADPVTLGGIASGPDVLSPAGADPMFTFSFIGTDISGSGTLNAVDDGGGVYTATSGSGTIISPTYTGTIALIADPTDPGTQATSPSGYFYYDDVIAPSQSPTIDYWGLLFATTAASPTEINLYSDGSSPFDGGYIEYDNTGYNVAIAFGFTAGGSTIAVGLPTSLGCGLATLCALGIWGHRRRAAL